MPRSNDGAATRARQLTPDDAALKQVLRKHWGYDEFRPLQHEAVTAALAGRDSLIVLPTGGGKSLCYQVPAAVKPGLAVVVSPLISLMKDQVDALRECGLAAAAVHSGLTDAERRDVAAEIRAGRLQLLYVAPERLMSERMLTFLAATPLSFIAIDEAHCISDWGHDFRPDYRLLGQLREIFPAVSLHAFTATATQRVQTDIVRQLGLRDPLVLVGGFDRPNLTYRVTPRAKIEDQLAEVLDRHRNESGIIYCISRKAVDALSASLKRQRFKVAPYHAGLSDRDRARNQDAFLDESVDIVVATVAFGMGIDKSNVRFVAHTGAPKSLENYQQETGRAGRDGLPAECCLFYSSADFQLWRRMHDKLPAETQQQVEVHLRLMQNYCSSSVCRHAALVQHFGQTYAGNGSGCEACDLCLEEVPAAADPLITAQKILSCVLRVRERFGADYIAQVLVGARAERILDNGHDQISTYGLLKAFDRQTVRDWLEQLCSQGFATRDGEYQVITLTPAGREVLKGEVTPTLLAGREKSPRSNRSKHNSAGGSASRRSAEAPATFDAKLFERLRQLRRQLAQERGVPPFVIFSDNTLQHLSADRPATREAFSNVYGIGQQKLNQYGDAFLAEIARYVAGE